MKNLLFIILGFTMLCFKTDNSIYNNLLVIIDDNSKLSITGFTNISEFNCDLIFSDVNSKINTSFQKDGNNIRFNNTSLELSNTCFDCGSKLMNSDFLEMVNNDKYPFINLDLKEVIVNPKNRNDILALVNISIAGCSKFYSIWLNTTNMDEESLKVDGCLNLKLSDFNLEAPSKILGLIVVNDAIEINFDLKIKTNN